MAKGYSYTRFSSAGQASGDSLRRQLAKAQSWADANGVELDTTLRDFGVSAFKGDNRVKGALASFLSRLDAGEIETGSYLIIEQFDRLSRESETQAINLLTGITLKGVRVVTLNDGAIYDERASATDLLRAIIAMGAAHAENKNRAGRVRDAWAEKKRKAREEGVTLSRRGPAWLEYDDALKGFTPIEERADVVGRIFSECLAGMGGTAIASRLNADQIKPFVASADGWHPGYVLTILRSRATYGAYQPTNYSKEPGRRHVRLPDGDLIEGYYPAVIEADTWLRAQAVIDRRNKRGGGKGRRGKSFPNLIIGLGRCEDCGGTLIVGNRPNSARVRFLRCYQASRRQGCENRRRYLCREVEDHLCDFILTAKIDDDPEVGPDRATLTARIAEREDVASKIAALVDQLESGSTAVVDRLRQREAQAAELDREIERLSGEAALSRHASPDAIRDAVEWHDVVSGQTDDPAELYAVRAKANSLLVDRFDWIMPLGGDGELDGLMIGRGERVWTVTAAGVTRHRYDGPGKPTLEAVKTTIL